MFIYLFDDDSDKMVTHSSELAYLFEPEKTGDPKMNKRMHGWWTNFAKYHDPNGEGERLWPPAPKILRIGRDGGKEEEWPQAEKC